MTDVLSLQFDSKLLETVSNCHSKLPPAIFPKLGCKLYDDKPIWSESCENINQWYAPSNNPFVLSNKNFTSSPSSYTDSPGSNLIPNRKYKLKAVFPIDLTRAKNAYLSF